MTDYSTLFEYPAQPADEQRIREIEHGLGRRLPDDYTRLLSQTGGGSLSESTCYLPEIELPDGDVIDVAVNSIYGNGTTSNNSNVDLLEQAAFLMEEWDIPREVLLCADSEDGMHQCFVINYDLPEFPAGSVLYLDTDPDGERVLVADSFDNFLAELEPHPSISETEEVSQDGIGIKGVRYGSLSQPLQQALAATPTPDMEQLLRKATEPIAISTGVAITGDTPEGRTFYDVVYWIVQHVEPQHDPRTYGNGGREDQELTFGDLMGDSFTVPGQKYGGVGYTLGSITMWWDRRVKQGVLIETENGYIMDESYISQVLDRLRQN